MKDFIDSAVKWLALLGTILYGTGLCQSILYYSHYGVTAIDFVSPQYILAGIAFYTILACASSFGISVVYFSRQSKFVNTKNPFIKCSLRALLVWIVTSAMLGIVIFGEDNNNWSKAFVVSYLFLSFWILTLTLPLILETFSKRKSTAIKSNSEESEMKDWHIIVLIPLLIFFISFLYGKNIFANLPQTFGGPSKSKIQIAFKTNFESTSSSMSFIRFTDTLKNITVPYTLIKENTMEYVLYDDTSKTLTSIQKSNVTAVKYLKR